MDGRHTGDGGSRAEGELPAPRVLIVEDDAPLAGMLAEYLGGHGFDAQIEPRGDAATPRIIEEQPDLVILDLGLPGKDGLAVCRSVRPRYAKPILMLTARGDATDEVVGLEIGADDYLAKPVKPRVLLARVRALLRRLAVVEPGERLRVGELAIDAAARTAAIGETVLDLTSGEFELLWLLASHAGQVMDRQRLYDRVRGVEYDELDRSIDLRVSRLRQKITDAGGGRNAIKTVRGVGYLYVKG
jgi:two-component system response regulator RstA